MVATDEPSCSHTAQKMKLSGPPFKRIREIDQAPKVPKAVESKESGERSEVTSSDEDSCDPKKSSSSSDSSVSERSEKRSTLSDDEESNKKKKVDSTIDQSDPPSPTEDCTSWGLAAFMTKDVKPSEKVPAEKSAENHAATPVDEPSSHGSDGGI